MVNEITELLEMVEFLDDAVFVTATLLYGMMMLMLLKRKKKQNKKRFGSF